MEDQGIIKTVGTILLWAIAIMIALCIFGTAAEIIIDLASTGVGTILLIIICAIIYKKLN